MNSAPVALITGAAHRVGATLARAVHQQGFNVVIHYRQSHSQAKALQAELQSRRPNSVALVQSDLLDTRGNDRLIAESLRAWGRLDALVNNASSFFPTQVGSITEEHWTDLMGTNLKAPLFLTQSAAPHLRTTRGCIVNIVDIHAERPLKNHPLYSAAKAGLVMLTKSLARELAPDIRVNGVAPGAILWPQQETDEARKDYIISRTALRRQGSPEEVAKAVLFLINDASYITGQIITVDGGRTLSN
jgi:pteridine reductase